MTKATWSKAYDVVNLVEQILDSGDMPISGVGSILFRASLRGTAKGLRKWMELEGWTVPE